MKKFIIVLGAIVIGIVTVTGRSLYYALRGIGPAIGPTPTDITKLLPASPAQPVNTTEFPLTLPQGFSISIFSKNLTDPRVLAWDPAGNLLTSITSQGKVVAVLDKNSDGVSDETITVLSGLNRPHGLAFYQGKLYVAEENGVAGYDYDGRTFKASNKKKIIDLPTGGNHFSRTIGIGPDNKLYVSFGSSCNACIEKEFRRPRILVANPDGTDLKEFASGLRNSVFFTWHPVTRDMWATEMGRDLLGDDVPPDEINIIKAEKNYGWPICYGKNIHDTQFDKNTYKRPPCTQPFEEPSYIDIPAHSAPLGLAFIPANSNWPKEYWNNLLVSFHGSWNRTVPTGYKIVRMKLDDRGNYIGTEDFITGWLTSGGALGRPVDLLFDSKGNLYVSDDKAGVIYKVQYEL